MEKWLSKAWDAILKFPPGETVAGAEIIKRLRKTIGEPDNNKWWATALMEAEMGEKLIFGGEFDHYIDALPVNPIYKIPGTASYDFWDAIKERTA
tara:strand:+ start:2379 stop:2663 length:285 start_codon:yes stop_codon:yes gene_type:complete